MLILILYNAKDAKDRVQAALALALEAPASSIQRAEHRIQRFSFVCFKMFQKLFQDVREDVPEDISRWYFTICHTQFSSQNRGPCATFAVAPGGARLRPDSLSMA